MHTLNNIFTSDLKQIKLEDGDVLHGIKKTDFGYKDFGEAYFSSIKFSRVKAWKKHTKMTMNLIVPLGEVKFVMTDGKNFQEYILSRENYMRLTVPPMIWFGFQGKSDQDALILNISDILHDPNEVIKCELDKFSYDWSA